MGWFQEEWKIDFFIRSYFASSQKCTFHKQVSITIYHRGEFLKRPRLDNDSVQFTGWPQLQTRSSQCSYPDGAFTVQITGVQQNSGVGIR